MRSKRWRRNLQLFAETVLTVTKRYKKIFIARVNFSKMKEGLEARMGSSVYVKRLTKASDHNEHEGAKKSSTKRSQSFI